MILSYPALCTCVTNHAVSAPQGNVIPGPLRGPVIDSRYLSNKNESSTATCTNNCSPGPTLYDTHLAEGNTQSTPAQVPRLLTKAPQDRGVWGTAPVIRPPISLPQPGPPEGLSTMAQPPRLQAQAFGLYSCTPGPVVLTTSPSPSGCIL